MNPFHLSRVLVILVLTSSFFAQSPQTVAQKTQNQPIKVIIDTDIGEDIVLLSEPTLLPSSLRQQDLTRLRTEGLATTDLLSQAIHLWKTDKHDAAPWPHIQDLNTLVYLMGGWVSTRPGTAFLDIGPRNSVPGFRVEDDPEGRTLLGSEMQAGKAAALRELVMQRLCAPPRQKEF